MPYVDIVGHNDCYKLLHNDPKLNQLLTTPNSTILRLHSRFELVAFGYFGTVAPYFRYASPRIIVGGHMNQL